MTVASVEPAMDDLVEELYDKLSDKVGGVGGGLTYVAKNWLSELLQPLGYERKDQSLVSHGLTTLEKAGFITRESVKRLGGHHAARRANYPKPRKVTITVIR